MMLKRMTEMTPAERQALSTLVDECADKYRYTRGGTRLYRVVDSRGNDRWVSIPDRED